MTAPSLAIDAPSPAPAPRFFAFTIDNGRGVFATYEDTDVERLRELWRWTKAAHAGWTLAAVAT